MAHRIFFSHAFAAGDTVALPQTQSRHLQVLRLQPGDGLSVFNGNEDLEWRAEVVRMGRAEVEIRIVAAVPVRRELKLAVTLALGVPANERMDAFVEKATELGVAAIQPLICERSVVRLAGDRAEARRLHWSAVAASASEQCGRVRVPMIGTPMKYEAWLRALDVNARAIDQEATRFVLSFDDKALSPDAMHASRIESSTLPLTILSGPEGGLSPNEEALAFGARFVPLSLGPRVLRADTAPLAWLAWLGLSETNAGR